MSMTLSLSRLQSLAGKQYADSCPLSFQKVDGKPMTFTVVTAQNPEDAPTKTEKKAVRQAVYDSLVKREGNGVNSDLHNSAISQSASFKKSLIGKTSQGKDLTLGDVRQILKSLKGAAGDRTSETSLYRKPTLPVKPGVRTGKPKPNSVSTNKPQAKKAVTQPATTSVKTKPKTVAKKTVSSTLPDSKKLISGEEYANRLDLIKKGYQPGMGGGRPIQRTTVATQKSEGHKGQEDLADSRNVVQGKHKRAKPKTFVG